MVRTSVEKAIAMIQLMINNCEGWRRFPLRTLRESKLGILKGNLGALVPILKNFDHLDKNRLFTPSKRAENILAALQSGYPHYNDSSRLLDAIISDLGQLKDQLDNLPRSPRSAA